MHPIQFRNQVGLFALLFEGKPAAFQIRNRLAGPETVQVDHATGVPSGRKEFDHTLCSRGPFPGKERRSQANCPHWTRAQGEPGTEAWPNRLIMADVHHIDAGGVLGQVGVH